MAKKSNKTAQNATTARIARTEAYAEKVRAMFAATVNRIIELNKRLPNIEDGEMFSFDAQTEKLRAEVERALRQLHSVATTAIQQGIEVEWNTANNECDQIVQSVFGKKALNNPEFGAWLKRNNAAMRAFIARSDAGMNLSDRVWQSTRQLRDEMEIAITCAIGDGTSAATMSRHIRQYLNDPDLMFRRFRYKDPETGEWRRKWKKRVIDPETGKVTWIDYDKGKYEDQWTGRGYYKSAAQNAMRVARTETNIAYRRADHARWQQMDFVLGQRVQMSKNHPRPDICDKLAGDYPKDFVFDGWHPQCFCFVTPILIDDDVYDSLMDKDDWRGELQRYADAHRIKDYPENFQSWVNDNADKIADARRRGTEPYFIRNNAADINEILNPQKQPSPLEIAKQRHASRTPEQEESIRLKWQQRQERIEAEHIRIERAKQTAQNVLGVAKNRFKDFNIDTSLLDNAIQSGDVDAIRTETRALAQQLSIKQQKIKQTAANVIGVASKYKDITGTEAVTLLSDVMSTSDVSAINAQTRALAQKILAIKQQLQSMSSVIPNPQQWAGQFTVAELQAAHDAIQAKLASWSHLTLEEQAKKLKFEAVDFLGGNMKGVQQKYPTWKVSQDAYMKRLDEVKTAIELAAQKTLLSQVATFASTNTKSKNLQALVADAQASINANEDIITIKAKVASAQSYMQKLQAQQARRAAKKGLNTTSSAFDADAYSQERRDNAMWAKQTAEADAQLRGKCGEVWRSASSEERAAIFGYTAEYKNINEPLRGQIYYGPADKAKRGLERIPFIESIINKSTYDFDMWVQRGDDMIGLKKFGLANYDTATDAEIFALVGKSGVEGAFWSAGVSKGKGFSGRIIFNIYMPRGTKAMYCEPFSKYGLGAQSPNWDGISTQTDFGYEAEILIQRGTKFRVTKVEKGSNGVWYIDVDVIEQNPVSFPYAGGYPFM